MSDAGDRAARREQAMEDALRCQDEQEVERARSRRDAQAAVVGKATATPGWYPDPEMAGTRRYWDGAAWTEHRAPLDARPSRNNRKTVKRIGWAVGFLFFLPVLFITLDGPSFGGESCGTWVSPVFTDLEVSMRQADVAIDGGGMFEQARVATIADRCNTSLATQRLIALILLGLGVGARIGIPMVANALRD